MSQALYHKSTALLIVAVTISEKVQNMKPGLNSAEYEISTAHNN